MISLRILTPRRLVSLAGPLILGLGTIAAGTGAAFEPAEGVAARFHETDCWNPLKGAAPTECGWLVVPERWDRATAKRLKLPVVVYRPRDPDPSLAPVIYLSGGPGYPALGPAGASIPDWRGGADYLFPGRTVVVFDQRGSGLGQPRLACPKLGDLHLLWGLSTDPERFSDTRAQVQAAFARCHRRLLAEGTI